MKERKGARKARKRLTDEVNLFVGMPREEATRERSTRPKTSLWSVDVKAGRVAKVGAWTDRSRRRAKRGTGDGSHLSSEPQSSTAVLVNSSQSVNTAGGARRTTSLTGAPHQTKQHTARRHHQQHPDKPQYNTAAQGTYGGCPVTCRTYFLFSFFPYLP